MSEFAALPAVIEGEFSLTHAQLWERVDRLSNALHGLGVRKGNVLMAWLPNCHEAIEAELACLQSGVIWVTVNTRFTWNEVAEILTDCQPKIFVTDEKHLGTILKSSEAETFSGE
ncbi:AMP-binding protein, partial [Candidatus Sumerlaeota bacterium]|nr:AMP-binding protein [Candidatus Sumerlaeota bacterium]